MKLKAKGWNAHLKEEMSSDYFKNLMENVNCLYETTMVFPPKEEVYNAFELVDFNDVRVVILGQDPYHGAFQANGLSFSVSKGVKLPPSLQNIYKELESDLGIRNINGDLTKWAEQGVFLLNATLTVEEKKAGSHQKLGWEKFTDAVIEQLSKHRENIVFILWGSYAQKKGKNIDRSKHFVIETVHPSPLSVYRGFFGSKPFSQTNDYLESKGLKVIDWKV
ncbi:uracil-DNA glycosylase [Myroides marinus]|uniref:Uracil-DNA glycosylase n=1 Tax=Myroides marinus TaxID=703342 RepID=A0A1H6T8K1_9FLAO|nr:uracil-DNA glycosylase [Myroides marinus]KUF43194.1 uracil-DNA glycosylase [Myroides marinus]MDM1350058.1 uracil-DNA glycosylase [Myroides marinus]MDM1357323.1 uracil-DNA glycosylase [Myroides marinus]MDM1363008.1 uracil-DNA glycosylase [Myroides marinus]MDM1364290.1 uracil-DNA glycosylase [Myroides marinus]